MLPPADSLPAPETNRRWLCKAAWLIPLGLIGLWLLFIGRNYEIQAYSDPLNWLRFARGFETEIHTSKFALGFPVFLRAALDMLGPYYIFLVNVPVLLAAYLLSAVLAVHLLKKNEGIRPWQVITVSLVVFFSFDHLLVLKMANPFRDPLSYLLLIGAVLLAAKHTEDGGARWRRPLISGLLMGLACCVREPSILMVVPFGLFALWSWRADPRIRFWRDAALFGAGLAVGLMPLMGQSLLSTGQALLPPQSSVEQRLIPGMQFERDCPRINSIKAFEYYVKSSPWSAAGVAFLLAGAIWGVWRRNRLMVALLILPALLFFVFYLFYWAFVPRYFYSAMVFAVPVITGGFLLFLRWTTERIRAPGRRSIARASVVVLLAAIAGIHLATLRQSEPRFQIPQARQLAEEMKSKWPDGSLIFARRHMCEILEWFCRADSYPATALISSDVPADDVLRGALPPVVLGEAPVFLLETATGTNRETDAAMVDRVCGLDLIRAYTTEDFHLKKITGADRLALYQLRKMQPSPAVLPGVEIARTSGARFDFSLQASFNASSALAGERLPSTLARPAPRMQGVAEIILPGPVRESEMSAVEVRLRSPKRGEGYQPVEAEMGGQKMTIRLRKDRTWQASTLRVPGPVESPRLILRSSEPFDVHYADWRIASPAETLDLRVGEGGDELYLRDGWYGREMPSDQPARWTSPSGAIEWNCSAPGAPGRIEIECLTPSDPARRSPPRLKCNETELRVVPGRTSEPGTVRWAADIPEGVLQYRNVIRIEHEGWTPPGRDTRTLGLFVRRIEIRTNPAKPAP